MGGVTQAWLFLYQSRTTWSDQSIYWWLLWVENKTIIPIWHLQVSSHSPVEMPLFYARLAFVALNKLHTSTEAEIESIVGPSLCHALQQTSGLLFCCPISSPIQRGQRRAGVWPSESHSPSCCPLATWHGDNEVEGEEATAPRNRSGVCWKRRRGEWVSETELMPPQGICVSPQPPAGHQRLQRGQIAEDWVWNNSCLINQRVDAKEHDCNDLERLRMTVSMHSQHTPSAAAAAAVTMTLKL